MIRKIGIQLNSFWHGFRVLILLSAAIFISSLIIGYMYTESSVAEVQRLSGDSRPDFFFDYFLNNLSLSYINVIGMISFGLSSIYILFINGLILGGAIKVSIGYVDNFGQILLLVVPHGITEIAAISISGALGFLFIRNAIVLFRQKNEKFFKKEDFSQVIVGLVLIFLLIGVSAIIEFYVTPDITDFIN